MRLRSHAPSDSVRYMRIWVAREAVGIAFDGPIQRAGSLGNSRFYSRWLWNLACRSCQCTADLQQLLIELPASAASLEPESCKDEML